MPEQNDEMSKDHGNVVATWEYLNYQKHKRTTTWYVIASVLLFGLVIFSLATQDYLFLVIIGVIIAIYVIRSKREPVPLTFEITEDGIIPDPKVFYEWKDIKDFWIVYEPPEVKNLYFDFKSGLRPSITIPLENQNPLKIRKILLEYIPEETEKENESLTDGISRILKL